MNDLAKTIIYEYLLGYVFQGLTICIGIYAFSKVKIESVLKYFIGCAVVIAISILTKKLGLSYGVPIILNLLALFVICIVLLRVPAINAIKSTLFTTILLLGCEMLNVVFLNIVLGKEKYVVLMDIPLNKAKLALPSEILFAIITIILYYFLSYRRKEEKKDNGTISA